MSKRIPTLNIPSDLALSLLKGHPEIALQIAKNAEQAFYKKAMDGIVWPHFEQYVNRAISGADPKMNLSTSARASVEKKVDEAVEKALRRRLDFDVEKRFDEMFAQAVAKAMPEIVREVSREVARRVSAAAA